MKKALLSLFVMLAFVHFNPTSAAVMPAKAQQAAYPEPVLFYMAPFDISCQLVFVMNSDNDQIIDIYAVHSFTQERTYNERNIVINPDGKSYSLYVDNDDNGNTQYTYGTISGNASSGYGYSCTWETVL